MSSAPHATVVEAGAGAGSQVHATAADAGASAGSHVAPMSDSVASKQPGLTTTPTTMEEGKAAPKKRARAPRESLLPPEASNLRHFSLRVARSVQTRKRTTYNEVADDLVAESLGQVGDDGVMDEKNIRRRVYDALNVLVAMEVVRKDGKLIFWTGFPAHLALAELRLAEAERDDQQERIERKHRQLQEMVSQQVAYKQLLERNAARAAPPPTASRIHMPFILCATPTPTTVDCALGEGPNAGSVGAAAEHNAVLHFSRAFSMHDDTEVPAPTRCLSPRSLALTRTPAAAPPVCDTAVPVL